MERDERDRQAEDARAYMKAYLDRARDAQALFEKKSQTEIDRAVMAVGKTVFDNARMLAELAVSETGMGNVEDKVSKNVNKAGIIWNSLKGKKSLGILRRDEATGITEVAKPVGVVAAITPCTNPIVTPMSNAMFALKGGNAIIVSPHHRAVKCSGMTVSLIRKELEKLGLPKDLIQMPDAHSRENTRALIGMADVVVATGGSGMVKAAYSSGKPALGVGAGNVQCIVDRDADISEAIPKIVAGRGFDNGIICSGEQSVICPDDMYDAILAEFKKNGAYAVTRASEKEALRKALFPEGQMSRHATGQSAAAVAKLAGYEIPEDTKIILVEADGAGAADLFSKEKICPVLATYRYRDFKEAVEIARANLEIEGKGHSVSIHSNSIENIEYAGKELCVSRFVVNQVCAESAGGSFQNGLNPTNTLGCGSWGNNSISENLTYTHLINISRIAYHMPQNRIPTKEELWRL